MIILAPMEGVVDFHTRALLTELGGIDYCVTEFIRVTESLLPNKTFYRYCPELFNKAKTKSSVPVFIQLLGSSLKYMAANAERAYNLGAYGIDINFGCPAKKVNNHDGGAALLKCPERIYSITKSVRNAVPLSHPVTVKIRLGYESSSQCLEIAKAAEEAGAHWLTVHARTKLEGYRPPAHWHLLKNIKKSLSIPTIANGDIWNPKDLIKCKEVSECENFMIGRGAIARPSIFNEIHFNNNCWSWDKTKIFLKKFIEQTKDSESEVYCISRFKQWNRLLIRTYPEAEELFHKVRKLKQIDEIRKLLQ